jgi:hypothetical protein
LIQIKDPTAGTFQSVQQETQAMKQDIPGTTMFDGVQA